MSINYSTIESSDLLATSSYQKFQVRKNWYAMYSIESLAFSGIFTMADIQSEHKPKPKPQILLYALELIEYLKTVLK